MPAKKLWHPFSDKTLSEADGQNASVNCTPATGMVSTLLGIRSGRLASLLFHQPALPRLLREPGPSRRVYRTAVPICLEPSTPSSLPQPCRPGLVVATPEPIKTIKPLRKWHLLKVLHRLFA